MSGFFNMKQLFLVFIVPLGVIPLNAEPAIAGQILLLAENIQILSEAFIPSHFFSLNVVV